MYARPQLTVSHLHDASVASDTVGQLEASGGHVARVGARQPLLVGLASSARGVEEEPSPVGGVDGLVVVVFRAVEGVLVQAGLGDRAVRAVGEVGSVTQEHFDVALCQKKKKAEKGRENPDKRFVFTCV